MIVPDLNALQAGILDVLRRDGVATVPLAELLDDATWSEVQADVAPFVAECEELVRTGGKKLIQKKYLLRRFWSKKQSANHVFSLDDPWLRVFASPEVLGVVNAYRNEGTKLYYLDNWFTVPFAETSERLASQRWHRDPEDEHVVKAFLYLADVDEGAGPFEYIRGSTRGGPYGELWPYEEGVFYPPQDELELAIPADDRLTLAGPAGTLIFADTGGFHRGGFSLTKPRVSATATYVPERSMTDRRFDVDLGDGDELSSEVRFALNWAGTPASEALA